jgi:hypothetical protein
MTAIVSTVEHLVPYESEAYMCLGVILAYVADCILGIKTFSHWGVLSIILALLGVFLIADVKFQIKRFRINLIIRLVCDVGLGYCARYALLYCSNAMYILLLNLMIVLIFWVEVQAQSSQRESGHYQVCCDPAVLGIHLFVSWKYRRTAIRYCLRVYPAYILSNMRGYCFLL